MQGRGCVRELGRRPAFVGESAVEVDGEPLGGPVADRPQRADDVRVAGELEGSREVQRLVGEPGPGGGAGGEVGESAAQSQGGDVGHRQRVPPVVGEEQGALPGIDPGGPVVAGEVGDLVARQHGEHSAVVRTLRKQYAATLLDDGQYRRALPELRRLADEYAAEAGTADPRSLQFRYEAAQCLEQLGEPAAALAEYRALLPYFENQYVSTDRDLPLEVRRRIGHLLLALGDRPAAQDTLLRLLHDAEQRYGPGHPLPAEVRRTLHWLGLV